MTEPEKEAIITPLMEVAANYPAEVEVLIQHWRHSGQHISLSAPLHEAWAYALQHPEQFPQPMLTGALRDNSELVSVWTGFARATLDKGKPTAALPAVQYALALATVASADIVADDELAALLDGETGVV